MHTAVPTVKEVPRTIPDEFLLAGFLERADPRDAWVNIEGKPIAALPDGAAIGTSAPRRRSQIRTLYPRLRIDDIRGNVDTRINKLRAGLYHGAILASAALTRLRPPTAITPSFSTHQI